MRDIIFINPLDKTHVSEMLELQAPPLNLMYLGASLEKASFSVKILDDNLKRWGYEQITKLVEKLNPFIIGVTATTATIKNSLEYIKSIKRILPDVLTIIGGPHPTFLPIDTLKALKELDVVVIGEGEETFTELAEKYEKKGEKGLEEVKGIAYRDQSKIRVNEPRPLIRDLDSLPFPARHLVPFKEYETTKNDQAHIITSRGCIYSCEYCSSSLIMGKKFRARSPENVVDEIEELYDKYKIGEIGFIDDAFVLNKRRAHRIAEEIKERSLDIRWSTSSRVNTINKQLLSNLKSAGLQSIYYGVESGSQRVLDLMNKKITLKQSEDAVKIAKDLEIEVMASFMFGYPGETPAEMDKTIDFSIKLDPDYAQYSILTPFPGTPIYYKLEKRGLIEKDWEKYTVLEPVIKYEKLGLSREIVKRKLLEAYFKFYRRLSYYIKHPHMIKVVLKTLLKSLT
ncbi:B12-binding domain-containing radical SAM protein [Methanothermobacter tenebrarum]|uniref:B12-binding domain-containing radical SAM protein n=1 Tax=Methanothermobacter tenebrarum TaxID=680118 RepID=A0A328PGM2_9EURY|nr:radical SAM protein [Methanothermobacter tenebrarum]NPV64845.1 B12-binding domain-containing radical SAM protein [Methanobacteriaceae archaeon]RAO78554.1 B12-binding domain-containing radical SAM protein [Methanothermobacter tenebrarum]